MRVIVTPSGDIQAVRRDRHWVSPRQARGIRKFTAQANRISRSRKYA